MANTARPPCGRLDCSIDNAPNASAQQIVEHGNASMVRRRERGFVQIGRGRLCVPVSELTIFARPSYYLVTEAKKAENPGSHGALAAPAAVAPGNHVLNHAGPDPVARDIRPLAPTGVSSIGHWPLQPALICCHDPVDGAPIAMPKSTWPARCGRCLQMRRAPSSGSRLPSSFRNRRVRVRKLLAIGLVSALGMIVSAGLLLLDAFLEGRLAGSALFTSSLLLVAGCC